MSTTNEYSVTIYTDTSYSPGDDDLIHTWIEINDGSTSPLTYSFTPATSGIINVPGDIIDNEHPGRATTAHQIPLTQEQYEAIRDTGEHYKHNEQLQYDYSPDIYDEPITIRPPFFESEITIYTPDNDHNCVTFSSMLLQAAGITILDRLWTPGEVEEVLVRLNRDSSIPEGGSGGSGDPDGGGGGGGTDEGGGGGTEGGGGGSGTDEGGGGNRRPRKRGRHMDDIEDRMNRSENMTSPLVLDLDGDGIELSSLADSQVFFDLDARGLAENTGWCAARRRASRPGQRWGRADHQRARAVRRPHRPRGRNRGRRRFRGPRRSRRQWRRGGRRGGQPVPRAAGLARPRPGRPVAGVRALFPPGARDYHPRHPARLIRPRHRRKRRPAYRHLLPSGRQQRDHRRCLFRGRPREHGLSRSAHRRRNDRRPSRTEGIRPRQGSSPLHGGRPGASPPG